MAIQTFNSISDVFDKIANNQSQLDINRVYCAVEDPSIGDTLFTDDQLTNKVAANSYFGIFKNGQTYALRTDVASRIVEIELYIPAAGPEGLTIEPPLGLGVVELNSAGDTTLERSRLAINTADGIVVSDVKWNDDFDNTPGFTKALYISTEDVNTAINRDLTNLNLTDMEGFDIALLPCYVHPTKHTLSKYCNHYLHLPSNGKNRRILNNADGTYYWMPPSHNFTDGLLPTFFKDFPDYEVPSGVYSLSQFLWEEDMDLKRSHRKGNTHQKDRSGNKIHRYDYEQWARNLGMPRAYSPQAQVQAAWNSISEVSAKSAFRSQVVEPNKHIGVLTLNFEVFSGISKNDQKLKNVLNEWKNANPSAKLAIWSGGTGGVASRNAVLDDENSAAEMTSSLKFSGSYNSWLSSINPGNPFGGNYSIFSNLCDIFYCNDYYLTRYNSPHWLQQYLMMYQMNKKFFPDKICLFMLTALMETTVYSSPDYKWVHKNGTTKKYASKPVYPPGIMFTIGLFSTAYGDGHECWGDPYYFNDDQNFHGDWAFDANGQLLPNAFRSYPNHGTPGRVTLGYRPLKNIDWLKAGEWSASMNKDIINANTSWNHVDISKDGGSTWITGDSRLPSETIIDKNPIAYFKSSSSGIEGLIIFFDPYNDPLTEKAYKVRLGGSQVKNITQYGDYASCLRITI